MEEEFQVWLHNLDAGKDALHNLSIYVKRAASAWDKAADRHVALWTAWKDLATDSIDETGMSVGTDSQILQSIGDNVKVMVELSESISRLTVDMVAITDGHITEARKDLTTMINHFKVLQQRHKDWDKAAKYVANGKGPVETEQTAKDRYEAAANILREITPQFLDSFDTFLIRITGNLSQMEKKLLREWQNSLRDVLGYHHRNRQSWASNENRSQNHSRHASDIVSIEESWQQTFLQIMPAMEAMSLIGSHGALKHIEKSQSDKKVASSAASNEQGASGSSSESSSGETVKNTSAVQTTAQSTGQWFGALLTGQGRIHKVAFHQRHHDAGMFWSPEHLQKAETVIAEFDFHGDDEGDLHFNRGDSVIVLDHGTKDDPNWWRGKARGREGIFPCNYVRRKGKAPKGLRGTSQKAPRVPPMIADTPHRFTDAANPGALVISGSTGIAETAGASGISSSFDPSEAGPPPYPPSHFATTTSASTPKIEPRPESQPSQSPEAGSAKPALPHRPHGEHHLTPVTSQSGVSQNQRIESSEDSSEDSKTHREEPFGENKKNFGDKAVLNRPQGAIDKDGLTEVSMSKNGVENDPSIKSPVNEASQKREIVDGSLNELDGANKPGPLSEEALDEDDLT